MLTYLLRGDERRIRVAMKERRGTQICLTNRVRCECTFMATELSTRAVHGWTSWEPHMTWKTHLKMQLLQPSTDQNRYRTGSRDGAFIWWSLPLHCHILPLQHGDYPNTPNLLHIDDRNLNIWNSPNWTRLKINYKSVSLFLWGVLTHLLCVCIKHGFNLKVC